MTKAKLTASILVRYLYSIWHEMEQHTAWSLISGTSIKFWSDCWVSGVGTLDMHVNQVSGFDVDAKVKDFLRPDGGCDRDKIGEFLPVEIRRTIELISPSVDTEDQDEIYWNDRETGKFLVKSAYGLLSGNHVRSHRHERRSWSRIWMWQGPERVKLFA